MAISLDVRVGSTSYQTPKQVDTQKLDEIFGYKPTLSMNQWVEKMTFSGSSMVTLTGFFYKIVGRDKTYTVCPSEFSKKTKSFDKKGASPTNDGLIKGDGLFEGPWDETGQKIANLFFSNHREDSIIYINDKHLILKKESGSINFV